jgi:ABC-type transport system involved in multi-copper enzyme maturation permease subunit
VNALYHLIRADFLERTRRYSFLVMLGLVLWLGYLVNIGQVTLRLDTYRGVFNSAWVGSMMTLVVNFLLGWFGFYLVKNSIARDYETGVGQIMATTPLTRAKYMLGKWLSNFLVLDVMVFILMLAAIVMQVFQREDAQIHVWALIAPFLFVALPFMAFIAALAVLFESIHWLRGSFGNIVYFFLFIMGITTIAILLGVNMPLFDWLGFGLFKASMGSAAKAAYPAYAGGLSLSMVPASADIQPFYWTGVAWTLPVILTRMLLFVWSLGLVLIGALFFDRFDSSRAKSSPRRKPASDSLEPAPVLVAQPPLTVRLTPLSSSRPRSRFGTLFLAELRMSLKGLAWWWYLAAAGLIVAAFALPLETVRTNILSASLILPLFLWSGLGCRESKLNTRQLVFSAPRPLQNQLPVAWLAGFVVSALMGVGAAVQFIAAGETSSLLSLLVGMLFIPSLALMLGVWTGSSKAFEVVYVLLWYLGLLNKVSELDYLGMHTTDHWLVYFLLSVIFFIAAIIGRQRQLKNG